MRIKIYIQSLLFNIREYGTKWLKAIAVMIGIINYILGLSCYSDSERMYRHFVWLFVADVLLMIANVIEYIKEKENK
jgi:hypothetical protein